MNRRGFLGSVLALFAAPAVGRVAPLLPASGHWTKVIYVASLPLYDEFGDDWQYARIWADGKLIYDGSAN